LLETWQSSRNVASLAANPFTKTKDRRKRERVPKERSKRNRFCPFCQG